MSTLGKAVIHFAADTAQFAGDIGRAAAIFERGVGRMLQQTLGLKSALASTFTAGGAYLFFKGIVDTADQLGKLSEKVGLTTEKLSELRMAARLGDVDDTLFKNGLRDFNRSLVEAGDLTSKQARLFKALGVDIKQGPEKAFRDFVDAFSKLPEGELRTAVAMEVLKKSGAEWIPVLAKGTKGLDEAAEKARRLGDIVSTDFARQAEEFKDNLMLMERGAISWGGAILKHVIAPLVEMTGHVERGIERGETWLSVYREIGKLGGAAMQNLPLPTPDGGILLRRATEGIVERAFEDDVARANSRQVVTGRIRGTLPEPAPAPPPDPKAVREALGGSEALVKRQIAAIQQMEERKRSLFNMNEREILQLRITDGTYKDFDRTTKARLVGLATEIDRRAELIQRIDLGLPALQAEFDARERGAEVMREFRQENEASLEQLGREVLLVGELSRKQEISNALRSIDLTLLARKRQAAAAYGDDVVGLSIELIRLENEATRQRKAAVDLIVERQNKERDWLVGAKQGLMEYAEAATNAGANMRQAFGSAFQSAEGALVQFARTGKLEMKDLAQSIAADFARAAIRQNITGPLAGAVSSMLGSLFTPSTTPMANGGIMTSRGSMPLNYYAAGGIATGPQLAVFGEGRLNEAFVPLPDGRSIPVTMRGGGRGDTYVIDARNADAGGMARLEAMIAALNGSIEHRAINGIRREAMRRGGRM